MYLITIPSENYWLVLVGRNSLRISQIWLNIFIVCYIWLAEYEYR